MLTIMLNSLFHLLIFFSFIIRIPLAFALVILRPLSRPLQMRIDFERKNLIDDASQAFWRLKLSADYLFHVSSEGELEQSQTLIDLYLEAGKRIEIIFTSPSVEKKCRELYLNYPNQVRILRLPVASFFPINFLYFQSLFQFVTAPVVIMCRYDFFPELLYLKFFRKKMILLSAATKKWNQYKFFAFGFFDLIIAATPEEAKRIQAMVKVPVVFMEFRFPRIFKRLECTPQLFASRIEVKEFCQKIIQDPREKIVLGSLWPSDLDIFQDPAFLEDIKSNRCLIVIAPHKLNRDYVEQLIEGLRNYIPRNLISIVDQNNLSIHAPIVINLLPGMLCELYQFFDCAYVGGGHEKSIHSVLEPFLMGAKVICGNKVHRSTEYDYILEIAPKEIVVLNDPKLFYTKWKELKMDPNKFDRLELQQLMMQSMLKVIEQIG